MSFGARLTAARKKAGLTQAELGRGLATGGADAGKQVVYGWEKDQHYPRVDQLILICEKLNCSADYLLFGVETNVSPRYLIAKSAVDQLSDEERLELFAAITQPGLKDEDVERLIPATQKRARPARGWLDPVQKEYDDEGDDVRRVQDQDDARTSSGGGRASPKGRGNRSSGVG